MQNCHKNSIHNFNILHKRGSHIKKKSIDNWAHNVSQHIHSSKSYFDLVSGKSTAVSDSTM